MSEIVKQGQLYARQSLVVNPSGAEIIRRTAICPTHTRQSSQYLGATEQGWAFRCREGHDFYARPDSSAPKTADEVAAWVEKQRQVRLREVSNGG
jgi:hypothetical protein